MTRRFSVRGPGPATLRIVVRVNASTGVIIRFHAGIRVIPSVLAIFEVLAVIASASAHFGFCTVCLGRLCCLGVVPPICRLHQVIFVPIFFFRPFSNPFFLSPFSSPFLFIQSILVQPILFPSSL